tara:strand:+ start:360 stop:593 length:234 start_codon:yes stop_codon:yes gene_type:complete
MPKVIPLEKENLEAHVDLCAERYNRLEIRLEAMETAVNALHTTIISENKKTFQMLITATATVIGGVLSTIIVILLNT